MAILWLKKLLNFTDTQLQSIPERIAPQFTTELQTKYQLFPPIGSPTQQTGIPLRRLPVSPWDFDRGSITLTRPITTIDNRVP